MEGSPFFEMVVNGDLDGISPIGLDRRCRKCAINDKHLMSYGSETSKEGNDTIPIWGENLLLNGKVVVTGNPCLGHILVGVGFARSAIPPRESIWQRVVGQVGSILRRNLSSERGVPICHILRKGRGERGDDFFDFVSAWDKNHLKLPPRNSTN